MTARWLLLASMLLAALGWACSSSGAPAQDAARDAVQAAIDGDRAALAETFAPSDSITDAGWQRWQETFPDGCTIEGTEDVSDQQIAPSFDALTRVTVACPDYTRVCSTFQDEIDGAWRQSLASPLCTEAESSHPASGMISL